MSEHNINDTVPFGFWIYLMSDCVLFAALFATYAVLQNQTAGGLAIYDFASLPQVFVETALLLTSSFTMGLTLVAAEYKRRDLALLGLCATLVLGLGFVGLEVREFVSLIAAGHGPNTSAFLSSFFALVGTHGLHVTLGMVWMLVVGAHVWLRGLSDSTMRKLKCLVLFWHFLDLIWIFIFTLVYLIGILAL